MIPVYLAARYSRRAELISYIPLFEQAGFEVVSRWLTTPQHADIAGVPQAELDADPHADRINAMAQGHQCEIARMDLEDVNRAAAFVIFTHPPGDIGSRGGRLVEYGYALGRGKEIVICGPRESFFFMLDWPNLRVVDTVEEAAVQLQKTWDLGRFARVETTFYTYSADQGLRPAKRPSTA